MRRTKYEHHKKIYTGRIFCAIAGKIIKIEVDLVNLGAKLQKKENKIINKMNKIYLFCSATETVAALESIYGKRSQMETEMRLLINSAESNMKNLVLLEALGLVLAVADKIAPHTNGLKEKQQLMANAREAFGTHVLRSRMDRLVSPSTESLYSLFMGKCSSKELGSIYFEKSACFFKCAINYGNSEAFAYLGWNYSRGLGMIEDDNKALELYIKVAEMQDPECLYAMALYFEFGFGALYHFRLSADLGHHEAREVVEKYFVSVLGRRKVFTTDELQLSLHRIQSQFSRRQKNTRSILISKCCPGKGTLDSPLVDFDNSQIEVPFIEPMVSAVPEDTTSPSKSVRDIPPACRRRL